MAKKVIEVKNVSKKYGHVDALSGISFWVEEGEILGLVGPDGAGKTTMLRLFTALLPPSEGMVTVLGQDVVKVQDQLKEQIGYMPQRFSLYEDLTVRENLNFFCRVFGLADRERREKTEFFLELTGLKGHETKLTGQLSGGMKQKLALAANLIHRPKILFLDEPSTGVDPVARKEFWEVLKAMQGEGVTIVVATPYMEEAERCDRLVLINQGKVLAVGSKDEIISMFPYRVIQVESPNPFAARKELLMISGVKGVTIYGNSLHLITACVERVLTEIPGSVSQPVNCREISPGIEDSFIFLTEKREGGPANAICGGSGKPDKKIW